nr:MAG TPA: hypothetical protein [Caudoviricetes sp.]
MRRLQWHHSHQLQWHLGQLHLLRFVRCLPRFDFSLCSLGV